MSKSNDILGEIGLVHAVRTLVELRGQTVSHYNAMKRAQQAHDDHLSSINSLKATLGKHIEAMNGREEIVLVGEGKSLYAAHVYRVEVEEGKWETKVDFFTPRHL